MYRGVGLCLAGRPTEINPGQKRSALIADIVGQAAAHINGSLDPAMAAKLNQLVRQSHITQAEVVGMLLPPSDPLIGFEVESMFAGFSRQELRLTI